MATEYGTTLQGCDVLMRQFQILDSAGDPIPLDEINDIKINIYKQNENGAKDKVYILRKGTPLTGNGQVIEVDIAEGKVGFIVPRTVTKKLTPGLIYAEIEVQLEAGAEYESSLQKVGGDNYIVTEIIASADPVVEI